MDKYEIVEGTNHRTTPKFLVLDNGNKPSTVAAEFVWSRRDRVYLFASHDATLNDIRTHLKRKKLI